MMLSKPDFAAPPLELGLPGFDWSDLHDAAGLARLLETFDVWLGERDPTGLALLRDARRDPDALPRKAHSALTMRLAPFVGAFVARLFQVEDEASALRERVLYDEPVFLFRKRFVKKRLLKKGAGERFDGTPDEAASVAARALNAVGEGDRSDEEHFYAVGALRLLDLFETARKVARAGGATWTEALSSRLAAVRAALPERSEMDDEAFTGLLCDAVEAELAHRRNRAGDAVRHWPSLRAVHKRDFGSLVPLRRGRDSLPGEWVGEGHRRTRAEPFALTDDRGSAREAAAHIDACLYCHEREKDACAVGLKDKSGALTKNPLGIELAGCPLDEMIGEAQALRRAGEVIGALVAVTLDNPLCPGTGHRICNDCMKSCIFQKQDPVDIPRVETKVLDEVLGLPWGFEIWSLLTRFHPLAPRRSTPRAMHGKTALVVGLGPAGYTLAHYLLNEGFGVVAVDGLKIEPLPEALFDERGGPRPIHDVEVLRVPLESRSVLGFGGVSEYGITVRWDKSYLTMLYLNLARRAGFRAYDGVRFGGTVTLDDAWKLGFDHVAIAAGAGRPTLVNMKNGLARGIRQASDFLMALQLSGAFRRRSLANLQVRLPVIVVGSGLTAIDTATEALAYYVVQSERTLERYEALVAEYGADEIDGRFDSEERAVLDEALLHGRALREERKRAAEAGREPDFGPLLDSWGGVSIVYRRGLTASPAYRLNHEEVEKSLEEGVRYVEYMTPAEAHVDGSGAVEAVTFERTEVDGRKVVGTGEFCRLPARSVYVAAGTKPNVTYEREFPGTFQLNDWGFFQPHGARGDADAPELAAGEGFFTSYLGPANQTVSFYGDNHPTYAGSVVKAMASAKDGHRSVVDLFGDALDTPHPEAAQDFLRLAETLDHQWKAVVHAVRRLAPEIVEVVVRAPAAAERFKPGQFFRMQSYEAHSASVDGSPLTMEGLALTGASTDPESGLLSMIVLEMGASSRLCIELKEGEPVVVMGPTGRPSVIAANENVLLAGGGLGNAVLFSIARAFRDAGSRVLYFAGYRRGDSLFKREEIEAATDQVIWATDAGPEIEPARPQDRHVRMNIVEAMTAYGRGELGPQEVPLSDVDRILAIGSDGMMNAVRAARHKVLAPMLRPDHVAIGSINSPMQCMMKEVCAQCLQRQVDPITGEVKMVYSCFDQDQPLDAVDFGFLKQRLRQSSLQEKLTDLWLGHLQRRLEAAE